jgi:predicted RNase H-like nuclease (RuvC/YqgF family)
MGSRFKGFKGSLQGEGVAKAATIARAVDLEPIDRLEEKLKLLVGVIDRLRADNTRASDEIARLTRELDAARAQAADAESTGAEVTALREERDLIRSRVTEMLDQIEALNL